MTLHWGPGPQPRHVPWLGIELATLWFAAWAQSTELCQPGITLFFYYLKFSFSAFTRAQILVIFYLTHPGSKISTPNLYPNTNGLYLCVCYWGICTLTSQSYSKISQFKNKTKQNGLFPQAAINSNTTTLATWSPNARKLSCIPLSSTLNESPSPGLPGLLPCICSHSFSFDLTTSYQDNSNLW